MGGRPLLGIIGGGAGGLGPTRAALLRRVRAMHAAHDSTEKHTQVRKSRRDTERPQAALQADEALQRACGNHALVLRLQAVVVIRLSGLHQVLAGRQT